MDTPEPTALIEYSTVEAMVQAFEDASDEIRRGFDLLEQAQGRILAAFKPESDYRFRINCDRMYHGGVGREWADKQIARLHQAAIRAIIEKLNLRPTLSAKRWKELEEQIEKGDDLPPITVEGIRGMVEGVAGNLSTYFGELVDEVFEYLRPRGWATKYKTNSEYEVSRKVILPYAVSTGWGRSLFRPQDHTTQRLLALDNVFHFLDGKNRPQNSHYGRLGEAIIASPDGTGETEYFRFRCCRNGNLHLAFTRLDLLARFNEAAGGRRLRTHRSVVGGEAA